MGSGAMRVLLWAVIAMVAHAGTVVAQERPVLMLDTGGHMGLVTDLAFTPDGQHLVSAGHDKVIRVWDWETGRTVRTLRGQVGLGDEGKVLAMALSPDGRHLAAAGQMTVPGEAGQRIRIYDLATGDLQHLLAGHTGKIVALAFSPDGTRLVSGSQDRIAILWDVAGARPLHRLARHKAEIYAVGFTPDGDRVVTGSFDRTLRLWRVADGRQIAEMRGHGEKIYALAVSSSDGSIASGSFDGEIRHWDGRTGRLLRPLANQDGAQVGSLNFSPDGRTLLSTCGGGYSCAGKPQVIWDVATGRALQTYARHDNVVLASAVSPDGRLVATAGGDHNEIHIWDARTGEIRQILRGTGAPFWSAGFAAAGDRLAWGQTWIKHDPTAGYGALQWQLRLPRAGQSIGQSLGRPERLEAGEAEGYLRGRVKHGLHTLNHGKGGSYGLDAILKVARSGRTVAEIERGLADGYSHRSYSFSPDGATIVSGGSNGYLAAYDLRGRPQGTYVGHEGDVWAVVPSDDGRLLVSGAHDQTLRLWNLATRELIVTLFFGGDSEWVLWTPQGYYTGSPGADKIVGWQINRGPGQAADHVGAEQLRQHLHRPDIVERAIVLGSAEEAVREAPGSTFRLTDLLARPVPRFRILAPRPGAIERGGRSTVRIAIEATPDPVRSIRVQVNGRQVEERTPDMGSGGFPAGELDLDVPLAGRRNDVRIVLTNAIGERTEALTLMHEGEGALDKRGTLHILAIGVDKYPGLGSTCGKSGQEPCDLNYAGADARLLTQAIESRLGPGHTKVIRRVLVNGAENGSDLPTAANILDAFARLRHAAENDTVVASISGHGVNDGPNYRFLATNAEWDGTVLRGSTVVPWQVLQEAIESAKGRRILFADTCHAENAYNQRLGNAAYHANIIAYSAARFDQEALEDPKLGHGLFTYAVAEGLDGGAGLGARRQISTRELADYVIKRVDALAKALNRDQEPQYFKGRDAEDYMLARW
jgi:WD40 repeat protein